MISFKQLKPIILSAVLFIATFANAQQDNKLKMWYHADLVQDTLNGISLKQAYDFLKDKQPVPVIVAVLDSGIDTTQEDLKNMLWTNPGEIPGNGIHVGYKHIIPLQLCKNCSAGTAFPRTKYDNFFLH